MTRYWLFCGEKICVFFIIYLIEYKLHKKPLSSRKFKRFVSFIIFLIVCESVIYEFNFVTLEATNETVLYYSQEMAQHFFILFN